MTYMTKERISLHVNALREAQKQRDLCNGSVYSNLVKQLGTKEADIVMMNLMILDKGFLPPLKK